MPNHEIKLASAFFFFSLIASFANPGLTQAPISLTTDDEIRAGKALVSSFQQANGVAETRESKSIEKYLQTVGDKIAQHAAQKLPYKFHLDPNPAFRSAVAYPGGEIIVGGGVLALMQDEDELAVVLGHEIAHVNLNQCANRLVVSMHKDRIASDQFDKLSIEEFGKPYGKDGELAADREGLKLAVAAGYLPSAAIELLETYQFLFRQVKLPARSDSPSLEERLEQARTEIKSEGWTESKQWKTLDLP